MILKDDVDPSKIDHTLWSAVEASLEEPDLSSGCLDTRTCEKRFKSQEQAKQAEVEGLANPAE